MKRIIVLCGIMLLMGACATANIRPSKLSQTSIFYPEPPNEPKIQYLTGFTSSQEIEKEDNKFVQFVLGDKGEQYKLLNPYGVKMFDGKIFLADPQGAQIIVWDLAAQKAAAIGRSGAGILSNPVNLDKDTDKIYVADKKRGQIVVYDRQPPYRFIAAYGIISQFAPVAVAVAGDKLAVVDIQDHEIEILNKETGNLLYKFGGKGDKDGRFRFPTNAVVDQQGRLYVMDTLNFRFQVFKLHEDRAEHILSCGKAGGGLSDLSRPKGIGVDAQGRIWITDVLINSQAQVTASAVKIFAPLEVLMNEDEKDDFLFIFGGEGRGARPGDMFLPVGLCLSADPSDMAVMKSCVDKDFEAEFVVLVVNQLKGPSEVLKKVNLYAYGHKK